MNDGIMDGTNPKADLALARDLDVTLSVEQDEVPPVILGQGEYTTDAAGKPIELKDILENTHAERRKIAFERGILYARSRVTKALGLHKFGSDAYKELQRLWDELHRVDVNAAWYEANK